MRKRSNITVIVIAISGNVHHHTLCVYATSAMRPSNGSMLLIRKELARIRQLKYSSSHSTYIRSQFTVICRREAPHQYVSGTDDCMQSLSCALLPLHRPAAHVAQKRECSQGSKTTPDRGTRRQASQRSFTSGEDDVDAAVAGVSTASLGKGAWNLLLVTVSTGGTVVKRRSVCTETVAS